MRTGLVLLLGALLATTARADALKDALKKLQARYDTTKTLTADFHQTVEAKTLAGKIESKGKVSFEKPNRMRWDYAPPDTQLIVGDGETLWIYQPDDKQVIKAPLSQAFQARTPMNFLSGLGHVEQDFEPSLERETPDSWVLRLVPRQDKGIGTLTLTVRKADASVAEARIDDPLGTVTRMELTGEQRNVPLEGNLFQFTPPAGVDVVRPPA